MEGKKKYFLLNINEGENDKRINQVDKRISERFAPIFYGELTKEEIKNNECKKLIVRGKELEYRQCREAKSFVKTFDNISDDNIVFSIGKKEIFFFNLNIDHFSNYVFEF